MMRIFCKIAVGLFSTILAVDSYGVDHNISYWILDPLSENDKIYEVDFLRGEESFCKKTGEQFGVTLALGFYIYVYENEKLVKKVHFFELLDGYDNEFCYEKNTFQGVALGDEIKVNLINYLKKS